MNALRKPCTPCERLRAKMRAALAFRSQKKPKAPVVKEQK